MFTVRNSFKGTDILWIFGIYSLMKWFHKRQDCADFGESRSEIATLDHVLKHANTCFYGILKIKSFQ